MQIKSGAELFAVTVAGLSLFLIYAFVVGTGVDLIGGYFAKGCSAEGAGALRVGNGGPVLCAEFWLNRYQSLIGGLLAFFGALLAFGAVQQQIAQVERHSTEQRERENNAARSVVTHALSKLNSYAGDCVTLLQASRSPDNEHRIESPIKAPEFPEEVISVLKDAIRFAAPEVAEPFSDLLAQSQVHRSKMDFIERQSAVRASGSSHGGAGFTTIQEGLFSAMDLYLRSGMLFEYGRVFMKHEIVDAERLQNAFDFVGVDLDEWPVIQMRIRGRKTGDHDPPARSL